MLLLVVATAATAAATAAFAATDGGRGGFQLDDFDCHEHSFVRLLLTKIRQRRATIPGGLIQVCALKTRMRNAPSRSGEN